MTIRLRLFTRRIAVLAVAVLLSANSRAQVAEPVEVAPFTGSAGFQDISVGPESWYVAFHGTRRHSMPVVEAGWLARAAQLCDSVHKGHLVELRYIDEPLYEADSVAEQEADRRPYPLMVASAVYIPIFVPSSPTNIPPHITPSKMAAVRCVDDLNGLRPGKSPVSVKQALQAATEAGARTR